MLDLDPSRAPVAPRAAATVLALRPGAAGLEIYCIVRHAKSGFMGGLVAFPGGKVDPSDHDARFDAAPLHPRALDLGDTPEPVRALAVAACREALEEAALVPTIRALDTAGALSLRAALAGATFADALAAAGLTLDLSALAPFGRWITPAAEPRRFDAAFFLLASPEGQRGQHDAHETTDGFWRTPADVLARWRAGELQIAPPTARALELLLPCATLDDARALAARQSLLPVCPELVAEAGGFLALPGDPAHSVRERRVDGPTRFVLRDGRFESSDP
ncbi:MAG: hypothetical protein IT374_21255 [Polyangiaceae bacterium]|nr:hypothetical protein [Polyangiaceae bacterium]